MQLTVQTDYAFRILMYLQDRPQKRIQTKEISAFYNISKNHLVKIVNHLTNLGYIESIRGRYHGGIQLCIDPKNITLGKLLSKLETNMSLVECFSPEKNHCRITSHCTLYKVLSDAQKAFIKTLEKRTLHSLKGSTLF